METYGSARPERAQIEDSGFLHVRDFDGSALSNDKSNHGEKIQMGKGTAESKVHGALTFVSDTRANEAVLIDLIHILVLQTVIRPALCRTFHILRSPPAAAVTISSGCSWELRRWWWTPVLM